MSAFFFSVRIFHFFCMSVFTFFGEEKGTCACLFY